MGNIIIALRAWQMHGGQGLEEGFKRRREDVAMSGTGNGTGNDIGSNQVEGLDARQTGLVWEG